MPATMIPPSRIVGCDVGKARIVVFDSGCQQIATIPNRPGALAAFAGELDDTCLVVCEATGGHEDVLLTALIVAGVPAHRADARKVKAFIRSFGILGKTDAIDARALARYGQERHDQLGRWRAPDPHRQHLQALVLTRHDLVTQRVAFDNRLKAPGVDLVACHLEPLVECLKTQIAAIEAEIETLIKRQPALDHDARTLRTITGIGPRIAAGLLALMPELGTTDRRKAAALAGLAPHPRQSGTLDAYRRTKGGRPEVKRLLFMAALSASKHHKDLKAFYQRLIANGKKPMVALTALMRKIIVISNAKLREAAQNRDAINASQLS